LAEYISTGIQTLDTLLGGGYQTGNIFLLLEEPGAGGAVFGYHFIASNTLPSDKRPLFISTNSTAEEIWEKLHEINRNLTKESVQVVDLFAQRFPTLLSKSGTSLSAAEYLRSGYDPLNHTKSVINRGSFTKCVIDSLSYFILNYKFDEIIEFIEFCSMVVRKNDSVILMTMGKGMHDPRTETAIMYEVDGVFEMAVHEKETGLERTVKFRKMPGLKIPKEIIRYDLSEKGIKMDMLRRVL